MSWERILKSFGNPLLIPRQPMDTLRENLGKPLTRVDFDNLQFLDKLIAGIETTIILADYYDMPHNFDADDVEPVFVNYQFLDEGPLVMQEDMVMIDENLEELFLKIYREKFRGNSYRNKQLATFERLENKDWDEFIRDK